MTHRLLSENTQAILIDVQEKLTPLIDNHQSVVANIAKLIQGLSLLNMPLITNEQYPKGLGHTIHELKALLGDTPIFEKVTFSGIDDEATLQAITDNHRSCVIIFGIETHVCVLQTVMDLLDKGFLPVVVADAVGSRTDENKQLALTRMNQAGAIIASTEMVLFELCRSAKNPAFKQISALVK